LRVACGGRQDYSRVAPPKAQHSIRTDPFASSLIRGLRVK
jgi:hypothetical protein